MTSEAPLGEPMPMNPKNEELPQVSDWRPCFVRDGAFVEPCQSLQKAINGGNGYHGKGLQHVTWTNLRTGKKSRSFIVLRSGEFATKGGMVVNHCPFCGVEICDPVRTDEEKAISLSKDTEALSQNGEG